MYILAAAVALPIATQLAQDLNLETRYRLIYLPALGEVREPDSPRLKSNVEAIRGSL